MRKGNSRDHIKNGEVDRRNKLHAFLRAVVNKTIADYNGQRKITMDMIDRYDKIHDFCQSNMY